MRESEIEMRNTVSTQDHSDDSDDAPEEIGFQKSQKDEIEERQNIINILKDRRESEKNRRRDIQKRNVLQKEEKVKKLKELKKRHLPIALLKEIGVGKPFSSDIPVEAKNCLPVQDPEVIKEADEEVDGASLHGTTQFYVKVLPNELKRKAKYSNSAAEFKHNMLYRKKIPRESVAHYLATEEKKRIGTIK